MLLLAVVAPLLVVGLVLLFTGGQEGWIYVAASQVLLLASLLALSGSRG